MLAARFMFAHIGLPIPLPAPVLLDRQQRRQRDQARNPKQQPPRRFPCKKRTQNAAGEVHKSDVLLFSASSRCSCSSRIMSVSADATGGVCGEAPLLL